MYQLIYASRATDKFSHDELEKILETSRKNNSEKHITGILLYRKNEFLQVLEGDRDKVKELYSKIGTDPRHEYVMTYIERTVRERSFEDWSMGFENLENVDLSQLEGYNPIFDDHLASKEILKSPKLVSIFLRSFVKRTGKR